MKIPFLTVLTLAGSVQLVFGGDITGKVVLKGTPKPEITIDMSPDPKCGATHTTPVTTRHYIVEKDGGLADVIVYIKSGTGVDGKTFPAPSEEPVLDQKACFYDPYVMCVMVNQKLKIMNSDPTMHNVHATPRKGENKEFNLAQPLKGMTTEKSFPSPEVAVKFQCNVHPWMFAYVGVMDNPYFAVTGKDGTFKISGVPDGKYTIVAYHPKTHGANPGISNEITVDGATKVDFTIEAK
jgi:hypothetical protein